MAQSVDEFLDQLADVKGDPHAQAAVAAEFALVNQRSIDAESLRDALDAAATLHWFDDSLLVKMLDITERNARKLFEALTALPFVERYRGGERDLRNIHESTRLGWRKQLARKKSRRFRYLSVRAALCFSNDLSAAGRIEWIYQLLCGDPKQGATELERWDPQWSSRTNPEERYALTADDYSAVSGPRPEKCRLETGIRRSPQPSGRSVRSSRQVARSANGV